MENLLTELDYEKKYWFDGDKYLAETIRNNMDWFKSELDILGASVLELLPECRCLARKDFFDARSLRKIVGWCIEGGGGDFSNEWVYRLFHEELGDMQVELFKKKLAKNSEGMPDAEITAKIVEEVLELEGATAKRLIMRKWEW